MKRTKYHASKSELSAWFIQLYIYFYSTVRFTTINHFSTHTHTHTHTYIYIYILLYYSLGFADEGSEMDDPRQVAMVSVAETEVLLTAWCHSVCSLFCASYPRECFFNWGDMVGHGKMWLRDHIYIYIYIYLFILRQTVSLYHNYSLDPRDASR